ncbi:MAG: hypothetical protein ABS76_12030 [Pelagibacterium sp. SCN 64-44]|nr:MAG: hypothetical protein ABS76_12030 [Pelagibacterium sp. SCN 64-44]
MDQSPRLSLPYIMPGQAQKHVTHNEAIQALDALVQPVAASRSLPAPPASPLEGEAYLVAAGAAGAWAGHADEMAVWQAGAWQFLDPAPGWQVYVVDERTQYVFGDDGWTPLASLSGALEQLGINAAADATNRLAVCAPATLFTHAGNGHQLKLNKAAPADTASLLFQSGWSGRAEMGLSGNDSFSIKVSPDGDDWLTALGIDAATGTVSIAGSLRPAQDNAVTLGTSGARWAAIWSATGTIQTSDRRLKTEIAPCDLGLDFIRALEPVAYRWRVGGNGPAGSRPGARRHYGLLAQQVQAVLGGRDFAGHVLADPADPESEQGLRYEAFVAPLIAAMQELARRLDGLEGRTE